MSNLKLPNNQRDSELTPAEFKKLVCDLAVAIAPEIIKKKEKEPDDHDRCIAYLAYDFADAIKVVLKDRINCKI